MRIPDDLLYTMEHEWLKPADAGPALMGVTAYAAEQLSGVTFIELPKQGQAVKRGQKIASVESVKAVSDVYAPAGGTIVEVNEALTSDPSLLDEKYYDDGWICRIDLADDAELNELMDAKAYREYLDTLAG